MDVAAWQTRLVDGVYVHARTPRQHFPPGAAAVFLDRDGVIVELVEYLHRPQDVRLAAGAADAIAALNRDRIPVLVVSNQSGIGRGLFDWAAFESTQEEIDRQLAAPGARIDAIAACPFHEHAQGVYAVADHPCRKPNPGMVRLLADRYGIDVARSWMVGDHATDVEMAERAGLAGAVHVLGGHGRAHREALADKPGVLQAESLAVALGSLRTRLGLN